jgi:hypothetical protein
MRRQVTVAEYSVEAVWTGALACSLCKLAALFHAKMHVGATSIFVKTEILV